MWNIFLKSYKNDIHLRQNLQENKVQKEIGQKNDYTNTESVFVSTNKSHSLNRSHGNFKGNHNYFGFKYVHGEENTAGTDRSDCQTPIQHSRVMFREFEKERAEMEANCDLFFHNDNGDSVDNFSVDSENGGLE